MTQTESITIRRAREDDADALARLAVLDSQAPLTGAVILAEEDDCVRAAVSLSDGAVVADPFHRTLSLVELLRLRAGRLGGEVDLRRGARGTLRAWAEPR